MKEQDKAPDGQHSAVDISNPHEKDVRVMTVRMIQDPGGVGGTEAKIKTLQKMFKKKEKKQ